MVSLGSLKILFLFVANSANLLHCRSPFSCASSTSINGSVSHPAETGLLIHLINALIGKVDRELYPPHNKHETAWYGDSDGQPTCRCLCLRGLALYLSVRFSVGSVEARSQSRICWCTPFVAGLLPQGCIVCRSVRDGLEPVVSFSPICTTEVASTARARLSDCGRHWDRFLREYLY